MVQFSENELQAELHLPRGAGRKDSPRGREADRGCWVAQVHVVRRVEHLPAEPKEALLRHVEVLGETGVDRMTSWPVHQTDAGVAEGERGWSDERVRVEPSVSAGIGQRRIPQRGRPAIS